MNNSNYNYNLKMGYRLLGQYKLPSIPLLNIGILDNSTNFNKGYYNQENDNDIFNIVDYLNNDLFLENQTPCKIKLENKIYDYTTKNYNIKSYQSDAIFFDNLKKKPRIDADYGIIFNEDSNSDISFCFGVPNIKSFKVKPYNLSYMNINSKQRYLHSISGENIISKLKIYDYNSHVKIDISYSNIDGNETGNYDIDNSNNSFESNIITPSNYINNINTNKFYIEHSSFSLLNMQSKSGYNENNILSFENYYDHSLNNLREFLTNNNIRLLELNYEGIKQFINISEYKDKINDISNILFQNPIDFIKNKTKEIVNNYDLSFVWIIQKSDSTNIKVLNDNLLDRITNYDISKNARILFDLSSNEYVLTHPFYYNITDSSNVLFLQFLYLYYYKYSFDISDNNNISYTNLSVQDIEKKLNNSILNLNTMKIKLDSKLSFLYDKITNDNREIIQDISYTDITDIYDKYYYKKKRWTPIYFNGVFHQLNNHDNNLPYFLYETLVDSRNIKDTFIDNPNSAYFHNYHYKHNHDEDNYNGLFDDLPYFEKTNWIGFKVPLINSEKNNIKTNGSNHFFNVNIFKTIIPDISNILYKEKHCYVSIYNPIKNKTFINELCSNKTNNKDSLWYIKDNPNNTVYNIYHKDNFNSNEYGFLVNSNSSKILNIYDHFTIFFAIDNPVNDICKNNINVTENNITFVTNSNKMFNINLNKEIPSFKYNNLTKGTELKNVKTYKDIILTINNDNVVTYTSNKKNIHLQNVQHVHVITTTKNICKIYFDNEMFQHEEFELFKNKFLMLDIKDNNFSEIGKILDIGKELLQAYNSIYTYLKVEFSKNIPNITEQQDNLLKKKINKYKVTYIGKETLEYKSQIYYINLKKKYLLIDLNTIDTVTDTTFVVKERNNENIINLDYNNEQKLNILYGKNLGDKYKIYYEPEITINDISKQNVLYVLKYTIDYKKIKYKENIFDYHSKNNQIKFINDNDVNDKKFLNKKKVIKSHIIIQDVPLHKYDYYQSLRDGNTNINEIKIDEDNILYINDTKYIDNSDNTIYNHYITYDFRKSYYFNVSNYDISSEHIKDGNYILVTDENLLSFYIEITQTNKTSKKIHFRHKTDFISSTELSSTKFNKDEFDDEINITTTNSIIQPNEYITKYDEYINAKISYNIFGENLMINPVDSTVRQQNVRNNLMTTENNYQSNTQQENLYLDTTTYTSIPGSSTISMPSTSYSSTTTSTSYSSTSTSNNSSTSSMSTNTSSSSSSSYSYSSSSGY